MRFVQLEIAGAWRIESDPVHDERGSFQRLFCASQFSEKGLETQFVQHSLSSSARAGTLRGLHFQEEPWPEVKLVRCLRGAIFDVVLDLRRMSAGYRTWQGIELSESADRAVYIPAGCAHGFQSLTDDVTVLYLISEFYKPEAARGVRYDDPALAIDWPLPVSVISEKDRAWRPLD